MAARKETPRMLEVFEAWYADPDRSPEKVGKPRKISAKTIYDWIERYGWRARAAARDEAAQRKATAAAIKRRAEMLERHANLGRTMQKRGHTYLTDTGITTDAGALRAIVDGVKLERQAEGLPDFVAEILSMPDDELQRDLERALRAAALAPDAGGSAAPGAGDTSADAAPGADA